MNTNIEFETEMSHNIFKAKYMLESETETHQAKQRVLEVVGQYYPDIVDEADEAITKKWIGLAGGLWRAARNPSKNVSSINCTTLDQPEDSIESISNAWYWWAKFAAYGQGEGVDLSLLRPKGSKLHNSARQSTGAVSFMHTFDGILNIIAQQGRRGASLISLNIKHPDIPDFINVKDTEGVLETANISIHITDDFMEAVRDGKMWEFSFTNKYETVTKSVDARELFTSIAAHAWKSGDPGVQYIDNVRRFSNSDYLGHKVCSTNACSFTGDTLITTKEGVFPIKDLVGNKVTIFDGQEWVENSGFKVTGYDQKIYRVSLQSGVYFDVTAEHRFFTDKGEEKRTHQLQIDDKLQTIYTGEVWFNKVVSITELPDKAEKVYCTSVPSTSRFLVNSGIITGNSEQWLDPHNVCLLLSVNLAKYIEYGKARFPRIINIGVKILDAFRRYEIEERRSPSPLQLEKMEKLPRIGLGVTGLADYFIHHGVAYASEESIDSVHDIFGVLAGEAYKTSYEIARGDGRSFEYYDKEKYKQSPFVQNLLRRGLIQDYHLDYQAHVCKTTVAPNGTLTEIVEAGGGGVEPIFAKYFVRRERSTTGEWKEWFTYNHAVRKAVADAGLKLTKENVDEVTFQDYWVTAHSVSNMDKIRMMSAIQEYIDSAISITYNLEETATPQDVEDIYWKAWEKGIKNVSVFREGSKEGVLITDANYEKMKKLSIQGIADGNRFTPKRPEYVECDIFHVSVGKVPHLVVVGVVEGRPYEIFVTTDASNLVAEKKIKKGILHKKAKGVYNLLESGDDTHEILIPDLVGTFDFDYGTLGRFISMSLRHGVPVEFIVDQLSKDKNFVGFERSAGRILKKYIVDNAPVITSEVCPECGKHSLIYKEGCKTCSECGWSKCD